LFPSRSSGESRHRPKYFSTYQQKKQAAALYDRTINHDYLVTLQPLTILVSTMPDHVLELPSGSSMAQAPQALIGKVKPRARVESMFVTQAMPIRDTRNEVTISLHRGRVAIGERIIARGISMCLIRAYHGGSPGKTRVHRKAGADVNARDFG
jgi:hypothetical protein